MKEIVKSTRGTVHQYNDDSLDFKPYGDVGDGEGFRPFSFYIEVIDDGC